MCRRMSDRRYRAGLINTTKRNIYIKKPVVSDRFFYALLQNLSHLIPIPHSNFLFFTRDRKMETALAQPLLLPLAPGFPADTRG